MPSKAWLATLVLLTHAEATKTYYLSSMGPELRYPAVLVPVLVLIFVNTACVKRTCADASVKRRHCEPARAISPE